MLASNSVGGVVGDVHVVVEERIVCRAAPEATENSFTKRAE